ncbi:sterol carrier family protein [Streptomyces sp. NPDC021098]|uniref:sterol carrier family protein n=1 Tax=unclassified Streptomyces TaxID=2593676 RepID=UPI0037904B56
MPPRPRARRYDPAKTRAAVTAQLRHVRDAVRELDEERLDASIRAGGRSVRELIAHLSAEAEAEAEPEPEPESGAGAADEDARALAARCAELVVHTGDLAAATGLDVPYDRQALATAVRLLADALAAKAPGGSVELRIPPFAVVQCVEGPRHTRGTPPNVVETDPLTWIRLAAGRTGWAEALDAGEVTASGERADLAAHLPVLD